MSLNIINASGGGGGLTAEELAAMIVPGVGIEVTYENDEFLFDRLETLSEDVPDNNVVYIDCDKDIGEHHEVSEIYNDDTVLQVINVVQGEKFRIKLNTNGHTITWFDNITWVNGYEPTTTPVISDDCEGDTFEFLCTESTQYYQSFLGWILSTERPVFNEFTIESTDGTTSSITVETIQNGYAGTDEVQQITFDAIASGGTWTLTYDGQTTSALAYDINAADLKSALEALSNIAVDDISVTKNGAGDYTVTFIGNLEKTNVDEMTADGSNLIGEECTVTATTTIQGHANGSCTITITTTTQGSTGTNEVQTFHLYGSPVGGTFTITYDGQTTSSLAYDASNATIQSALEALSNIGSGAIAVSGSSLPNNTKTLTFQGTLRGTNVSQITLNTDFYNVIPDVTVTTTTQGTADVNEVQTISITGTPTGGTFTLTYDGQTTSSLAYDASNATIQSALEALSNLAPGDITITGSSFPTNTKTITFGGTLAATNVSQITINGTGLTGGTLPSSVSVTSTQTGQAGLLDNVVAHWPLDEEYSTTRTDIIGGYTFTSPIGLSANYGLSGYATLFIPTAAGTGMSCPNNSAFDLTGDYSIAFWAKAVQGYVGATGTLSLNFTKGNQWKFLNYSSGFYFSVGTRSVSYSSLTWDNLQDWTLFVGVRDSVNGKVKLSVNGGAFIEGNYTGTPTPGSEIRFSCSSTGYLGVNELIDQITIFDKALDLSEISSIYANGDGVADNFPEGQNEIQTVAIDGEPTTGSFSIGRYGSGYAATIPYNASAATAQSLFEALTDIGSGNMSVTGGPLPSTPIVCEFKNSLGQIDEPNMTYNAAGLTNGQNSSSTATSVSGASGINEIESITYDVIPESGTFTLTYGGQTTSSLDFDATSSEVQTALRALSSISGANVNCSGGPFNENPITIEFVGTLAEQNITQITSTSSLLGNDSIIEVDELIKGVPDLTSYCTAYWKLDEPGGSRKSSIGNFTLTNVTGTPGYTTGKISNCLQSNIQYYLMNVNNTISSPARTWSISCWIQVTGTGTDAFSIMRGVAGYTFCWELGAWNNPEANFYFKIRDNSGNEDAVYSQNFGYADRNEWYFISASYNYATKELTLQVNDTTANSVIGIRTPPPNSSTANSNYVIVGYPLSTGVGATTFLIDELAIWSKILTTNEKLYIYNNGLGHSFPSCNAWWKMNDISYSGPTYVNVHFLSNSITGTSDLTLTSNTSSGQHSTTGKLGNAVINSAGEYYYTCSNILLPETNRSFGITCWIKLQNTYDLSIIQGYCNNEMTWELGLTSSKFYFSMKSSDTEFDTVENNTSLSTSVWYHLAATFNVDTNEMKIVVNGGTPYYETYTGAGYTHSGSSNYISVFYPVGSGIATIDELAHWERYLSSNMISALYNSGSGVTTPLNSQLTSFAENETQTITGNSTYLTQGTFNLTFDGEVTSDLNYNATSTQISTALKNLSNIGNSDVSVTGGPIGTSAISVTFQGNLAYTDVELIVPDWNLSTYSASTTTQGVLGINEVESININPIPTSGTFTLTYDGQTTSSLNYNATASDIQTALIALSNIDSGDVSVTGGPINTTDVIVTFLGNLGKTNVNQLTATPSSLTASNGTNEIQQISVSPTPISGTFTLTFDGYTTSSLDYDATAAEVRDAFQLLTSVGWGNVVCSGGPINTTPINIEFQNALSVTDVNNITTSSDLFAITPNVDISTTQEGGGQLNEIQALLSDNAYNENSVYTITFNGQTTSSLNIDDDATTVQTALIALSNIGVGDISVTGGPLNVADFNIEFIDDMAATNQPEMTATLTYLPSAETTVDISICEVAEIEIEDGSGAYIINLENPIPGKVFLVKIICNSTTGTLSWSSNVQWGDSGVPDLPAENTYSLFQFFCISTTDIVGKFIESGLTI